jgi:hypothetical protein
MSCIRECPELLHSSVERVNEIGIPVIEFEETKNEKGESLNLQFAVLVSLTVKNLASTLWVQISWKKFVSYRPYKYKSCRFHVLLGHL